MLSRIWKKNTPNSTMATSTSKATPSSTTSGMPPVAETAARNSPFSIDMKPSTWATACGAEDHHQQPDQHHGQADGDDVAGEGQLLLDMGSTSQ